jgi:hypothetical protein
VQYGYEAVKIGPRWMLRLWLAEAEALPGLQQRRVPDVRDYEPVPGFLRSEYSTASASARYPRARCLPFRRQGCERPGSA